MSLNTNFHITFRNVTFQNNFCFKNAGIIWFTIMAKHILLDNIIFKDNISQNIASGLVLQSADNLTLSNSLFFNNSAYSGGGCVYLYQSKNVLLTNLTMDSNKA